MKSLYKLCLLLSVFFIAKLCQADESVQGMFIVVKGDTQVLSRGSAQPVVAKIGSKVHEGDTVTTGHDSRAKIVMSDNNVFIVSPDSQLVITKYRTNGDQKNVEINLNSGKLRSSLEQKYDGKGSSFEVRTPVAVAGVRGTDFITSFDSKTKLAEIFTFHGAVAVSLSGGVLGKSQLVGAGQRLVLSPGANSIPIPKNLDSGQIQKLNQEHSASDGGGAGAMNPKSPGVQAGRAPASVNPNPVNIANPLQTGQLGTMLDTHDLSPDATKFTSPLLPPSSVPNVGVGAIPQPVLPPPPPPLLTGVSGTVNGTTNVTVRICIKKTTGLVCN